ncbi:glutamate synthase, partial [Patescibacteria group bacterium AH-259-L07]|nr:glutamate synthase [Patescibacteria group bacterium AH-259-L07]
MNKNKLINSLISSRSTFKKNASTPVRKETAEGGCGVIGISSTIPIAGKHLLGALEQMHNRGNGKGGGIAAVGLDPEFFKVSYEILENNYLLAIAYLDMSARPRLESKFISPTFIVDHTFQVPTLSAQSLKSLEIVPPQVMCYFVRVKDEVRTKFMKKHTISDKNQIAVDDEIVYQNTYLLNKDFYASSGDKQAFVLSHGKNMIVCKMVGYGNEVIRYYRLENLSAYVWLGHHRYPTKGKIWHPGGAHPFIGMNEALVHNGDFANYSSICTYLSQRHIYPLFLTDTEVSALMFDLFNRVYDYPQEYVIEAMAPTTERDFSLLDKKKQQIYSDLQSTHLHASPDGPWFFLLAQSDYQAHVYRLIGITDTSMLRPQVFAIQSGDETIGFSASEKQAIDAVLVSLSKENSAFWPRADLYWSARGGSHTDGGAFIFTVKPQKNSRTSLICTDKFGHQIKPDPSKHTFTNHQPHKTKSNFVLQNNLSPQEIFNKACQQLALRKYSDFQSLLKRLEQNVSDDKDFGRAFTVLTMLMDRQYTMGNIKRSYLLARIDDTLARLINTIDALAPRKYLKITFSDPLPELKDADTILIIDAENFPSEGDQSLARTIVELVKHGFRRFILVNVRGQRFIGNGLGSKSDNVEIDVYGSSGDYLASGIDGATIIVHNNGQDQLAQIMKNGTLVVYGDVGQTFMYGAKGGEAYILGNAAGRPYIGAVGHPRGIINGTCLDYLAESFMAGDPLDGGGFVIVNGVYFDNDGKLYEMDTPYPGSNLFSLPSGGAIYLRDPRYKVIDEQLNGGEFIDLIDEDWDIIKPYLKKNEALFGIPLDRLLTVNRKVRSPEEVYRKIIPAKIKA